MRDGRKAKFDQESAFKSIIGPGQKSLPQVPGKSEVWARVNSN